jgi:hypothetical protein
VVSAVIVDFRFGFEVGVSGVAGLSSSTCTTATSACFSGTIRRWRGARAAAVVLGGTAGAFVVVMGLGALIVTLVLVAGATVAGLAVLLAAVLVVIGSIGGASAWVEGFSVEGGSCGGSLDAIVLQARARKTHGRVIATPSRKRWSAINQ